MVKEASIGEGMLFYYFGSKKELFHYLIEYSL
ncbi:MAG: TetR/AcrR family transcriptional regulator [Firmicutes bacterium]|nr:TetR/AcrR family transcriptional regulator [Bacillota bacterium]